MEKTQWPATLDLRNPVQLGLKWLKDTDTRKITDVGEDGWWVGWGYGDVTGRMVDAFILARQVLGVSEPYPEELRTREFLISLFDLKDGLSWRPETSKRRRAAHMFDQSSVLFGLVTWWMESYDKTVKKYLERLIEGLWQIAEKPDDYCYYPLEVYTPAGWTEDYDEFRDGRKNVKADPCHEGGRQIFPLVQYYELTGFETALKLAQGLANFVMYHAGVFEPDGSFLERKSRVAGHVHSRLATAAGVIKLGLVTVRDELIQWGKKVFDWAMNNVAFSFGWVSEMAHRSNGGCETCCITDAIEIALLLARNGYPEYWDMAERFARNHLLESQCQKTGGFSGHSRPNDYTWIYYATGKPDYDVAGCCSPAGVRGLYLIWDNIVTTSNRRVDVNFALNRTSEWVEVKSFLPHRGEIHLRVNSPCKLRYRMPDWAVQQDWMVKINDIPEKVSLDGTYILINDLRENDEVVITYPVRKVTVQEEVMKQRFTVHWRGNTVVQIEPQGEVEPLYRRANLDTDEVSVYEMKPGGILAHYIHWF